MAAKRPRTSSSSAAAPTIKLRGGEAHHSSLASLWRKGSPVLEALLAFVYEGSCKVEAGLLTEMLDAAARLVIDPLKAACAVAIQIRLAPCNALDAWRLADLYTLPALEKAAVTSALDGFEELPPQSASGAQVLALVQEDRLVAKSEEAVFQWIVRWQEAVQPTEAELLVAMKHVRFAAMDAGFVQTTGPGLARTGLQGGPWRRP